MNFLTIESHFGVPQNLIRVRTRNKCSDDLVGIIKIIASILYPGEEFEIFLLPAEDGSYKDVIKLLKNVKSEILKTPIVALTTIGILTVGILTYTDSHAEFLHSKKMWVIDDTAKCLSLKEQIAKLSNEYEIENIPDEKIKEVCGNIELKKFKNDRYKVLQNDEMISSDETIIKNPESEIIYRKRVDRSEFDMCIEPLPENEEYRIENLEGVIELISPVLKQKKEGKGITWRGIYHGENIQERGIDILLDEEAVNFYMQDPEFKEKINKHEVVFSTDENMNVLFNITGIIDVTTIKDKSIYIKEVLRINEDVIEHKYKSLKKNSTPPEDQLPLFI